MTRLKNILNRKDYYGAFYNLDIDESNSRLHVDLSYPRLEDSELKEIQIGLCCVRAADDIRISYDFNRDGWVIKQETGQDEEGNTEWKEVAFCRAWQLDDEMNPDKTETPP